MASVEREIDAGESDAEVREIEARPALRGVDLRTRPEVDYVVDSATRMFGCAASTASGGSFW
jgi:hypothetical protein